MIFDNRNDNIFLFEIEKQFLENGKNIKMELLDFFCNS